MGLWHFAKWGFENIHTYVKALKLMVADELTASSKAKEGFEIVGLYKERWG